MQRFHYFFQIEAITIPRYAFGLINLEDSIIVAGGKGIEHKCLLSVFGINMRTKEYECFPEMNYPRWNFNLLEVPCYNSNI